MKRGKDESLVCMRADPRVGSRAERMVATKGHNLAEIVVQKMVD